MRIVHADFDDLAQPWGGGQARRTFEINRRLAEHYGWHITVVTGSYPGARRRRLEMAQGSLEYRPLGGGPFPLNVLTFLLALPLVARRFPYDLIVEDFTTPVGPAGLPLWAHAPVVGSAQFLFAEQMSFKYHLPFAALERGALRAYRRLIALTPEGAAYLRQRTSQAEITVIPQGLDAQDFVDPGEIRGQGDYALFLGRLDVHQKGLDVLLSAWATLPAAAQPPLIIAGAGRDQAQLMRLVADLGLSNTVRLAGRVSGDAKRKLLREARLMCMPSRYETFGITAIEAPAAGIPLVASAIPGLAPAAIPGALLVPPDDPASLAAAVVRLWGDRQLRLVLATAGRNSVAHLTWDSAAQRQAEVYQHTQGGLPG